MIGYIKGKVIFSSQKFIILDVSGVGYKIHTTLENISSSSIDQEMSIWTHTAVRENSLDLYGFSSREELDFFEMLLDVSGIGPKSALGILSVTAIDTLRNAIATGDTSYLNKVSGIGRKTAEKIVIELRDKLQTTEDAGWTSDSLRGESDIIEALKSLGYSQTEARDALRQIPKSIEGASVRIKEALKILGKK